MMAGADGFRVYSFSLCAWIVAPTLELSTRTGTHSVQRACSVISLEHARGRKCYPYERGVHDPYPGA